MENKERARAAAVKRIENRDEQAPQESHHQRVPIGSVCLAPAVHGAAVVEDVDKVFLVSDHKAAARVITRQLPRLDAVLLLGLVQKTARQAGVRLEDRRAVTKKVSHGFCADHLLAAG